MRVRVLLLLRAVVCVFTVIVTPYRPLHSQYLPYGRPTISLCME